jgi:hypothetical protein
MSVAGFGFQGLVLALFVWLAVAADKGFRPAQAGIA